METGDFDVVNGDEPILVLVDVSTANNWGAFHTKTTIAVWKTTADGYQPLMEIMTCETANVMWTTCDCFNNFEEIPSTVVISSAW